MTKSELISLLAERYPHLLRRDVELLVGTILGTISDALARGGRIELRGFGVFGLRERDAYHARNPMSGEDVLVGKHYSPYFKIGKQLHERIN